MRESGSTVSSESHGQPRNQHSVRGRNEWEQGDKAARRSRDPPLARGGPRAGTGWERGEGRHRHARTRRDVTTGFPRGGARRSLRPRRLRYPPDREAGWLGRLGGAAACAGLVTGAPVRARSAQQWCPVGFLRVAFCFGVRQDVPILIKESGGCLSVRSPSPTGVCNAFCLHSSPPSIWQGR